MKVKDCKTISSTE